MASPQRGTWLTRLVDLADAAGDAEGADQAQVLWRAFTDLGPAVPDGIGRRRFEELLQAAAWESAALALMPTDAGIMLSRGANGVMLASVILPGQYDDTICRAASGAMALVMALAGALGADAPVGNALVPQAAWLN